MKKILLLAQTPPPFHGQAIMQKYLVDDQWHWCRKEHVRLEYSDTIQQVGHFNASKVLKLFKLLYNIWRSGQQASIDVIYYPPAGPNRIPLYRDIITLLFSKLFSKKIILHFHAGGLPDLVNRLNPLEMLFAKFAFKNVDHAIVLLPWLQKEVEWFSPKKVHVVPNGIEDVMQGSAFSITAEKQEYCNILFVGNLKEEKGVFDLLRATVELKKQTNYFKVRIMGEAHSPIILKEIVDYITDHSISDKVDLLGALTGEAKWKEFQNAHIFCLPTYATEAMPVSIVEAMMFSLPTVTTDWRGIPDMITNGKEGFLVSIRNVDDLAHRLSVLIEDRALAESMGKAARRKFEEHFNIDRHLSRMESIFKSCFSAP